MERKEESSSATPRPSIISVWHFLVSFSITWFFPLSIIVDEHLAVRQCMVYLSGNEFSLSGLRLYVCLADTGFSAHSL